MEVEKVINDIYEKSLNERPTFSKTMIEHMGSEINRVKKEAVDWVKNNKKVKNN